MSNTKFLFTMRDECTLNRGKTVLLRRYKQNKVLVRCCRWYPAGTRKTCLDNAWVEIRMKWSRRPTKRTERTNAMGKIYIMLLRFFQEKQQVYSSFYDKATQNRVQNHTVDATGRTLLAFTEYKESRLWPTSAFKIVLWQHLAFTLKRWAAIVCN